MPREASPVERRDGDKEKDSDPKRDAAPSGHREKGDRDSQRDRNRDRNRDRDRDRDGDLAKSRDRGHEHSKRQREDSRERGRDDDAKRARRSRSRERHSTRDREREPARRADHRDREPAKRPDDRERRSERERDHDRDQDRRPDRGGSRDRDRDRERAERHSSRRPDDKEAAANGTKADSHGEENGVADPEEGEVIPGAPEAKQKTEVLHMVLMKSLCMQHAPLALTPAAYGAALCTNKPCVGGSDGAAVCCKLGLLTRFPVCCQSRCRWRSW